MYRMYGSRTTHMYRTYGIRAMQEQLSRSSTPVDSTDLFSLNGVMNLIEIFLIWIYTQTDYAITQQGRLFSS